MGKNEIPRIINSKLEAGQLGDLNLGDGWCGGRLVDN